MTKKVIALIDSSKIEKTSSAEFANSDKIDILITDKQVERRVCEEVLKHNIEFKTVYSVKQN